METRPSFGPGNKALLWAWEQVCCSLVCKFIEVCYNLTRVCHLDMLRMQLVGSMPRRHLYMCVYIMPKNWLMLFQISQFFITLCSKNSRMLVALVRMVNKWIIIGNQIHFSHPSYTHDIKQLHNFCWYAGGYQWHCFPFKVLSCTFHFRLSSLVFGMRSLFNDERVMLWVLLVVVERELAESLSD